ncbi:putative protein kinase YPK3, partial [Ascoidea rubescens DSM 1968]
EKPRVTVSDFDQITVLGQGAYGKVILVRDLKTDKLFAQKQLKKASILIDRSKNLSTLNRTFSEKDILSKINHHFIVKLFYTLQDNNNLYFILQYVPGGEIFMQLSLSNIFNEKIAAFYIAEITIALLHLHKIGIVYRDLKPENCLLDSNGHIILTDFGLSKFSDNCNSIIGTPEYMAPEILKGETYSYPVDWWSLGTILFDMLTGKPPFTGSNNKVIVKKILEKKPKMPFYLSSYAKDMLNKLLNKNPEKRWNIDDDVEKFKLHRFFRDIDWKTLSNESKYTEIEAPIIPIITDPALAENFSEEFTSMKLSNYGKSLSADLTKNKGITINYNKNNHNTSNQDELFQGFSYTASNSYIDRYM